MKQTISCYELSLPPPAHQGREGSYPSSPYASYTGGCRQKVSGQDISPGHRSPDTGVRTLRYCEEIIYLIVSLGDFIREYSLHLFIGSENLGGGGLCILSRPMGLLQTAITFGWNTYGSSNVVSTNHRWTSNDRQPINPLRQIDAVTWEGKPSLIGFVLGGSTAINNRALSYSGQ